jgi:putative MATE family efflux protein
VTVAPAAPPRGVTAPIGRELVRLAVPVLLSQFLRLGYQWTDAVWVRGLGVDATASVTSSIFVLWWVMSLNDVFAVGVTAYASQLIGAGERRRAGLAAWKGIRASALLGLLAAAAGLVAAPGVFGLMGADPGLQRTGGQYLAIVLAGSPFLMVALTCENLMRSAGDTRTPLLFDLVALGINAVVSPLLVYGVGPLPHLGVAGAAWGTVLAQVILVGLFLNAARRGHRALPLTRSAEGPPIRLRGMVRVGLPVAIIGSMFSVVYVAFARAASAWGPASMAVVGIVNRIEGLQFISSVALGMAAATLVGQNLGAGRPDRAIAAVKTANLWSVGITVVVSVLMSVWPEVFLRVFSPDPEVLRIGVPYLRVLVLCFVVNGLEIVTSEAILASGHTRAMSVIFTTFSLARIPLAFVVPEWTGTGTVGIAWVITVTCLVRGLLIVAWASRGTWTRGLRRELHGEAGVA